jgi:sugar-specific transcriptional regulator TrmB
MILPLFQDLGLSPNEAKIYQALLTYGQAGVSTIALRAKVHRRNAYDSMQRLLEKGLVSQTYGKGEVVFQAVDPGKLMELIREKEMRLAALLPALQETFHTHKAPEQAYIFKGPEGVKNYLREVLNVNEDLYIIGAEGAWLDPRIVTYTKWFLREAKAKKIKIHALFDDDAHEMPAKPNELATRYKFLPKKYDTNTTIDIFGNYVVTYTGTAPGKLLDHVTIFLLYSPELANSYRVWWQMIWDLLPAEKGTKKKVRSLL